ncbi:MAG: hypothetical protein NDI94_06405 [Candidatus Woesearchaeota archaeon]|nr:hypothetical protein [Candidatus Woesearchaeota archaeon]
MLQSIVTNAQKNFGITKGFLEHLSVADLAHLHYGLSRYNLPVQILTAMNPSELAAAYMTLDYYKGLELGDDGTISGFISKLVHEQFKRNEYREAVSFLPDEPFSAGRGDLIRRINDVLDFAEEDREALVNMFNHALQSQYLVKPFPYRGSSKKIAKKHYISLIQSNLAMYDLG